jgi:hypothetical protein
LGLLLIFCDRVFHKRFTEKRIVFMYHNFFPNQA